MNRTRDVNNATADDDDIRKRKQMFEKDRNNNRKWNVQQAKLDANEMSVSALHASLDSSLKEGEDDAMAMDAVIVGFARQNF